MTIIATEIESIHGSSNQSRLIYYRCQDHLGNWHTYGPRCVTDPNFDVDGFKTVVAEKVAASLAEAEFNSVLGDID